MRFFAREDKEVGMKITKQKVNGRLDPFFIKRNIERIIISGGCRKTRNL